MLSRICNGLWSSSLPSLSSAVHETHALSKFFHTSTFLSKQVFVGTVVSDKPMKTVVVSVERLYPHPKYHKVLRKRSKFMAHDELDEFKVGDKVKIEQHRPISRHKTWMVLGYADPEREAEAGPKRESALKMREAAKEAGRAALAALGSQTPGSAVAAGKTTQP